LTSEGKRKKYLMSTFGEIKYERRLYKDKDNKWRYLLDERLNLGKNQRVSIMFLQRALEEAGEVSYRQARRNLSRVWGEDTYSHETIRGYVKKVGEEIKEKEVLEDNINAGSNKEEKKVVYLEADSTGIPIRDKEKYILDNFEGIKNRDKIREIESEGVRFPGIIEGNIDKVISNRFKKRGCCWSIEGCDSLFQA